MNQVFIFTFFLISLKSCLGFWVPLSSDGMWLWPCQCVGFVILRALTWGAWAAGACCPPPPPEPWLLGIFILWESQTRWPGSVPPDLGARPLCGFSCAQAPAKALFLISFWMAPTLDTCRHTSTCVQRTESEVPQIHTCHFPLPFNSAMLLLYWKNANQRPSKLIICLGVGSRTNRLAT